MLENVDFHHKRVCELGKVDVHHKRVFVIYLMLLLQMMMKMQEGMDLVNC